MRSRLFTSIKLVRLLMSDKALKYRQFIWQRDPFIIVILVFKFVLSNNTLHGICTSQEDEYLTTISNKDHLIRFHLQHGKLDKYTRSKINSWSDLLLYFCVCVNHYNNKKIISLAVHETTFLNVDTNSIQELKGNDHSNWW